MVLEATMICVDNSEWMRNGDYQPTRMEAQQDAVNLISGAKLQANPENTVGLLTMAGNGSSVQVALTQDLGRILACISEIKVSGKSNFSSALQIAQLALKHRQNKNQRQRVICFVGSPIQDDSDSLVKLAKKLKKNGVSVDIIDFGEHEINSEKLDAFIAAVDASNTSHILHVLPGPYILSDMLISSAILREDGTTGVAGGANAAPAPGLHAEYGGIDPNLDPELAMVMRLSLEEERLRQKRVQEEEDKKKGSESSSSSTSTPAPASAAPKDVEMSGQLSEEEELKRAIEMSLNEAGAAQQSSNQSGKQQSQPTQKSETQSMDYQMSEEEQMELALKMSMQDSQPNQPTNQGGESIDQMLQDQGFLNSIVKNLPGVDPNAIKPKDNDKKDDKKDGSNQ